jgi:hypothetical protein
MNVDRMNNGIISVDHRSSEQHPYVGNQTGGNSTQNKTNSKEVVNVINNRKKSSMIPTPLYVSFFFFQSS